MNFTCKIQTIIDPPMNLIELSYFSTWLNFLTFQRKVSLKVITVICNNSVTYVSSYNTWEFFFATFGVYCSHTFWKNSNINLFDNRPRLMNEKYETKAQQSDGGLPFTSLAVKNRFSWRTSFKACRTGFSTYAWIAMSRSDFQNSSTVKVFILESLNILSYLTSQGVVEHNRG